MTALLTKSAFLGTPFHTRLLSTLLSEDSTPYTTLTFLSAWTSMMLMMSSAAANTKLNTANVIRHLRTAGKWRRPPVSNRLDGGGA